MQKFIFVETALLLICWYILVSKSFAVNGNYPNHYELDGNSFTENHQLASNDNLRKAASL